MKKIKLVFLLFIIIFISGCDANYNIKIKSNGKVEEKLIIEFETSSLETTDPEKFLEDTIKSYKDSDVYVDYSMTKQVGKKTSKVIIKRQYNSLTDLKENSEILSLAFENILVFNDYDTYGIQTTGEYKKDNIFGGGISYEPTFDNITINVKTYNEFIETNASSCDKKTNVCTWNLDEKIDEFYLQFKYNNSKRYDIIIKEYINNTWPALTIIAIVIVVILVVYNVIKKRNSLSNEI